MKKLVKWLFGTQNKQLDIPVVINSDNYQLSIHLDRKNTEHIEKKNLFIKKLKEYDIPWETFTSEYYEYYDGFDRFNVSVDIRYMGDLKQIHFDVYGF